MTDFTPSDLEQAFDLADEIEGILAGERKLVAYLAIAIVLANGEKGAKTQDHLSKTMEFLRRSIVEINSRSGA